MKSIDFTRSDIFAALAFLVSAGSLLVSWLGYRRNVASERPRFWAQRPVNPTKANEWTHIAVHCRNDAPFGVVCETIKIIRPRGAAIIPYFDGMEDTKDVNERRRFKSNITPTEIGPAAKMRLATTHAGVERNSNPMFKTHGVGDTDDEWFFVYCPARSGWLKRNSSAPISLSMRITWRSKDESSRRRTSVVNMELMPATVRESKAK